jgi:[protein-PII] uridylyltransferase
VENPLSSAARNTADSLAAIRADFLRTRDPDRVLKWRSALVDRLVIAAWRQWVQPHAPTGVAVVATGGYGRHQLFPFSDVDLLLLCEGDRHAEDYASLLSPFLQSLWDAGLRVSQSVRTLEECLTLQERNVELHISLIDQRYLAGDAMLAGRLSDRLPAFLHGCRRPLVRGLARLTAERHRKAGQTIHHLEPNVKETPGGLRDWQVAGWVTQLQTCDGRRLASRTEWPGEEPARRFLFGVRCFLHYQSARDANVLTFDAQEAAAAAAGQQDPAVWMRDYFRAAREIHRRALNALDAAESQPGTSLFSHLMGRGSRLSNAEFTVVRERVFLRAPLRLEQDPALVLRLFAFVARHGFPLSQDARERLVAKGGTLAASFGIPGPWFAGLQEILRQRRAVTALREMHETGVLFLLFPELETIDCLVVRDFYHRYTVDEHSLIAIQILLELETASDAKAKPFSEILAECERRDLVVFALLFHDAGKGQAGDGHVEGSVWLAECAMERIQMPPEDRDMVRFLIQHHLELSRALSARDLSADETIRELAGRVGTVERLRSLALLTYCDVSAVNPNAMTPWRAAELFRLYRLVYHELTRELDTDRITETAGLPPEIQAFLSGFPRRYLLTHGAAEIREHFALAGRLPERAVAASLRRIHGVHQLTVAALDRPRLFAHLAGTLAAFGMSIIKAEAYSNQRGEALDTFAFADPHRTLELNPPEAERLLTLIERAAVGKLDVKQLLKSRPAVLPPSRNARIAPRVSFDNEASPAATLLQVMAQDRPGLLYELSSALSDGGCNIEVVLVETEAHRAIDVFFITHGGAKLSEDVQAQLKPLLEGVCKGQN